MVRRTLTIKRIDPWSVLKVGFLANLVLLGILLLAGRVVWFFIERLELIDRACEVAGSVGFQDCGLNGGNIFRNAMLLGLLGVVVQTGILVFGSFLHNLIAELTGGLTISVSDEAVTQPGAATVPPAGRSAGRTTSRPSGAAPDASAARRAVARPGAAQGATTAGAGAGGSAAAAASGPTRPTPSGAQQPPRPGGSGTSAQPQDRTASAPGGSPTGGQGQGGQGQGDQGQGGQGQGGQGQGPGPSSPGPGAGDPTQVRRPDGDLFGGGGPSAG